MARKLLFVYLAWILAFLPVFVFPDGAVAHVQARAPEAQTPPPVTPVEAGGAPPARSPEVFAPPVQRPILLKSRQFVPAQPEAQALAALDQQANTGQPSHILVQLDFIPSQTAKDELEKNGLKLLAYVPEYAWIASVPAGRAGAMLALPGVNWAGVIIVDDKLDEAIRLDRWSEFNAAQDGTVAVQVMLYEDVAPGDGRALVQQYGGKITSETVGINLLTVEMPEANLRPLAAEDSIQWIEPAGPPLTAANDGVRGLTGAGALQSAPYNLTGSDVEILIYDAGSVDPAHPDFSGRLTLGESAIGVADHSTHVAGTAAGSGAASISFGGSVNQWRGMAPGASIISYAYNQHNPSGILFYEDPGDIESNWAEAQNDDGADVGNASLGSNIYANYPTRCDLMGNYGVSEMLLDQIVRGGNSAVGIGDKYIATWAVGNERGSSSSCGTYSTISPPAGAKNPIHVGAVSDENEMSTFSSWGPTDDGRLKPTVVTGGVSVLSTIPNLYTNYYTRNCDGTGDDYCFPYDAMSGTSMAAPAVAGGIALLLQQYRNVYNIQGNFWPSTAKVLLIQTALDLGRPGPDYQYGYGSVNLRAAADLIAARGFFQANVAQSHTVLYYVPVTNSEDPLTVSLAWDDYQATVNANPVLINNLDLELVSPGGAVWQPWVLNPASPASNAVRGLDNRNNQEQVMVPNPEIGTWIVRVKGTTVPQGPQDYALACPRCKVLNAGACQNAVGIGTASMIPALKGGTEAGLDSPAAGEPAAPASAVKYTRGEAWQRDLEAIHAYEVTDQQQQIEAVRMAREAGPDVLRDLLGSLSGEAREIALQEIEEAEKHGSPAPKTGPILSDLTLRVGVNGACAYNTIQQAIDSAPDNAVVRISAGIYFEHIYLGNRTLTLEGGYNTSCSTPGAGITRIEGSAGSDSTIDITNGTLMLKNLQVAWGGSTFGAGIDVLAPNQNSATITLNHVQLMNNHGGIGGGMYIGNRVTVNSDNASSIYDNTATLYGGGVAVYGTFNASSTDSDITGNCAENGGGLAALEANSRVTLDNADVHNNQAVGTTDAGQGLGGGIYVKGGGIVTLQNAAFVGESTPAGNTAYDGAGIYADGSTVNLVGSTTTVINNTASHYGGGIYLTNNSTLTSSGASIGYDLYASNSNTAERGGGIYMAGGTLTFTGRVINNVALDQGAGLFADGGKITMTNATIGGTGALQPNRLGPEGHLGVGLNLSGRANATLTGTTISSNVFQSTTFTYGGGVYLDNASLTLNGQSKVEKHTAPDPIDGRGAGIYLTNGALTVDNSSISGNTAGASGGGICGYMSNIIHVQNGAMIDHNTATNNDGGGIAVGGVGTSEVDIQNASLLYNVAGQRGGAVEIEMGTLDFTGAFDVRFNQSGSQGGGIAVYNTGDVDFSAGGPGDSLLAVNHTGRNGGALYIGNNDTVELHARAGRTLNFNTNSAGGSGGAAYSENGALFDVSGRVVASSNTAGGNGGLFYLAGGSKVAARNFGADRPQLWVNTAQNGGLIYSVNSPQVLLEGVDVGGGTNGNRATVGSGGAIYADNSVVVANNSQFQNNWAALNGGAIAASNHSDVTVQALYPPASGACDPLERQCSSLHHNRADMGGNGSGVGGAVYSDTSALSILMTYLHHNSAYGGGGAVYQTGAATGIYQNDLVTANTSTQPLGAGIRLIGGTTTITHLTVADNTGAGISVAGGSHTISNSILWGNSTFSAGTVIKSCNIDQFGYFGDTADPLFVGGGDYHIQPSSPAVNACSTGLARDLDNRVRPFGGKFDIGAYEVRNAFYLPFLVR